MWAPPLKSVFRALGVLLSLSVTTSWFCDGEEPLGLWQVREARRAALLSVKLRAPTALRGGESLQRHPEQTPGRNGTITCAVIVNTKIFPPLPTHTYFLFFYKVQPNFQWHDSCWQWTSVLVLVVFFYVRMRHEEPLSEGGWIHSTCRPPLFRLISLRYCPPVAIHALLCNISLVKCFFLKCFIVLWRQRQGGKRTWSLVFFMSPRMNSLAH